MGNLDTYENMVITIVLVGCCCCCGLIIIITTIFDIGQCYLFLCLFIYSNWRTDDEGEWREQPKKILLFFFCNASENDDDDVHLNTFDSILNNQKTETQMNNNHREWREQFHSIIITKTRHDGDIINYT